MRFSYEVAQPGHYVASGRFRRLTRAAILALGLASFVAINRPAMGQSSSPGPVHLPAVAPTSVVTPAPTVTNALNFPASPAPAAPALAPQTTDTGGDIRDIRGVMAIPSQWLWAAYILIGFIVAGLLFAAWRYFVRQVKARAKQPFEIALEKLEAARSLLTVDTVREYAFAVSEIIRIYIEQRFGEKAARRTTEEFLSDLLAQTSTPLAQHRGLLETFLNHCDLIKFARWSASERELESMHESARAFILDTRPQPAPANAAVPALPQPELAQAK